MENITYIVDGQTLVNNIHFIKKCVYDGLVHVHIPTCATETAEKLYQKSLEPKESPKADKPKRWSGRLRREQQPLFDINPRTTTEFLERARSENGVDGVTLQSGNEEFVQWREEQEKAAKEEEKLLAPPSSFSEALLRKLNIKDSDGKTDDTAGKPKLVAKTTNGKSPAFRYHKVPSVPLKDVPKDLQSLFSCALWRLHDYENNPLKPENYELLLQDQRTLSLAHSVGVPATPVSALHKLVTERLLQTDKREKLGELEIDFPDAPKRKPADPNVAFKDGADVSTAVNVEIAPADEAERALEAVALSVVQGLEQPDTLDTKSEEQLTKVLAADLRPSVSYAIAAGSASSTPVKTTSLSPQQLPLEVGTESPALVEHGKSPILAERDSSLAAGDLAKKEEAQSPANDDTDSDEEVVVFNPKARQAAQANKKRRSHEVQRANSRPVSRPVSRPTTANGIAPQTATSRPSSTILNSVLKPQSPVFSPRQPHFAASPIMNSSSLASPTTLKAEIGTPPRKASPPERFSNMSPQVQNKQTPDGPRSGRTSGQNRPANQDAAQRQSELILQRQREAIKKSTQFTDTKGNRGSKEIANKAPPIEVDMRPTNNPVVIDPDDFGRDYTIKPGANSEAGTKTRGDGRGRRGGRGRAKPQPQPQQHQQQHQTQGARGADVDFVLKSGNPRGAARGKGKLWVP